MQESQTELPPSNEIFVDKSSLSNANHPTIPTSKSNNVVVEDPLEDQETIEAARGPYAPRRKGPRGNAKAIYKTREIINTRPNGMTYSDWYSNTNMNEKYARGDLQTVAHVNIIIKNCIEAFNTDGDTGRWQAELRKKLHEMEFYEFLSGVVVRKSRVLEPEGLCQIIDGPERDHFDFDIRADAEVLYRRWMLGDLDSSLLRGVTTTKGVLQNGTKRTSHKLEKDWARKSANVIGANGIVNGQWWPLRLCALRDGVHGEHEAGIHGTPGKGAYSVVIADGGYADNDNGEVCLSPSSSNLLGANIHAVYRVLWHTKHQYEAD
jgi:hypothetical protein